MGDAAQRPGGPAMGRAAPAFLRRDGRGVADHLDRRDAFGLVQPHGAQRPVDPGCRRHGGKGGLVRAGMHQRHALADPGMGEKAAQEAFPGDAAPIDAAQRGVIAVGGEPDRGVLGGLDGHRRQVPTSGWCAAMGKG